MVGIKYLENMLVSSLFIARCFWYYLALLSFECFKIIKNIIESATNIIQLIIAT